MHVCILGFVNAFHLYSFLNILMFNYISSSVLLWSLDCFIYLPPILLSLDYERKKVFAVSSSDKFLYT